LFPASDGATIGVVEFDEIEEGLASSCVSSPVTDYQVHDADDRGVGQRMR
jgi:hypothetical protein